MSWKDQEFEKIGRFGDVFPKEAVEKIDAIFERSKKPGADAIAVHKEILAALEPHREFLLSEKKLLVEYAAYAIEFAFSTHIED